MKIISIGISPYLYTSQAKVNAMILERLYLEGHAMAGMVRFHDPTYFLPEDGEYYYNFGDHKIPIVPLEGQRDLSIEVYEVMKVFEPDMIITVGDLNDFPYMKAVKMFVEKPFKWLAILMNYNCPISESNSEIISDMDGILCTSEDSLSAMSEFFHKDEASFSYVGCLPKPDMDVNSHSDFRVMVSGKNAQADNIPTLMQAVKDLRSDIPDIDLYVHSHMHDQGDFDFQILKNKFDPDDEFIRYPSKYVSLMDGYSDEDFHCELLTSDLFVTIPMNAASGLTVFDAISCGCLPLMTDTGCHREISQILGDLIPGFEADNFLVPCIDLMAKGETYLSICDPEELKSRIINLHCKLKKEGTGHEKIQKKRGYNTYLREFVENHRRELFLQEVMSMVDVVLNSSPTICVESV